MPMFTKEQKQKLVSAVKAYNSSLKKKNAAEADLSEKLNQLKTASQASGQGVQVVEESMRIMGEFYLESLNED